MSKRIPILRARAIAEQYEYDQVIIYARQTGDQGGNAVTTYGKDVANCMAAGKIGQTIRDFDEGKWKLCKTDQLRPKP